jgi:hypothetical protein
MVAQVVADLPWNERVDRYREFAEDALRQAAQTTDTKLRANHLIMASGWHALARKVEKVRDVPTVPGAGTEAQNSSERPPKN